MKKNLIFLITLFILQDSIAQTDIKLADLKTPNSPGFQILDISPSSIERPTNPKEFSIKVLNLINSGTGIPTNFAFEFSPFWYFKPKKESVYKYLGVGEKDSLHVNLNSKFSTGFLRKINISFASITSDSTTGSLLKNTNYISFGAKTNIITFRTKKQNEIINESILAAAKIIDDFHKLGNLEEIEAGLNNNKDFQENIKMLNKLPLIQLDAAYAYSQAFPGNKYSNHRFNRLGLWGTLAINADLKNKKQDNHSLSFICLFRTMRDNVLKDTINNIFAKANLFDFGSKIEYNINKFSISIEYINRTYDDDKLNSNRTVGLIQYKVNDNLYIMGTYGKNFGKFNNVFTLLGLNWGFGSNSLKISD